MQPRVFKWSWIFCLIIFSMLQIDNAYSKDITNDKTFHKIEMLMKDNKIEQATIEKRRLWLRVPLEDYSSNNFQALVILMNYVTDNYYYNIKLIQDQFGYSTKEITQYHKKYISKYYGIEKPIDNSDFVNYATTYLNAYKELYNAYDYLVQTKSKNPISPAVRNPGEYFTVVAPFISFPSIQERWGEYRKWKEADKKFFKQSLDSIQFYNQHEIDMTWKKVLIKYFELYGMMENYINTVEKLRNALAHAESVRPEFILEINNYWKDQQTELMALDKLLRYYIFDMPIEGYCVLTRAKILAAKGIIWDDNVYMKEAGLKFSKTSRFIDFTSQDSTRISWIDVTKSLKDGLSKKDYEELKAQSQIMTDWFKSPKMKEVSYWP